MLATARVVAAMRRAEERGCGNLQSQTRAQNATVFETKWGARACVRV